MSETTSIDLQVNQSGNAEAQLKRIMAAADKAAEAEERLLGVIRKVNEESKNGNAGKVIDRAAFGYGGGGPHGGFGGGLGKRGSGGGLTDMAGKGLGIPK